MKPTIVCITGMHRSGTSLLAKLMHAMGVYLGEVDDLLGAHPSNPAGHWEHVKMLDINERLLRANDGTWNDPPKVVITASLVSEARELVKRCFDGRPLWGWKDPRNCLTLDFWREVLDDEPIIVSSVRHPDEVVQSLKARNGTDPYLAAGLWYTYNGRLSQQRRYAPERFAAVWYPRLLADPLDALVRVRRMIPGLRHHGIQRVAVPEFRHHESYRELQCGEDGLIRSLGIQF
ncbi:MAG: sulfotransferase [Planctomycetes bacterium]|nr:sulfotransferase [Planctomycetota bacterium]